MSKHKKDWRKKLPRRRAHRAFYDAAPTQNKLSRDEIAAIRRFLADYKSKQQCKHCGESHPACLGFHHIDPREKIFCIAEAPRLGYGLEAIKQEMRKCEILCHNCHARLHWGK